MIQITHSNLNFEREPLATPFGFKGGFLTELWQTIALLTSESGLRGVGLGVQSVLWSDPRVFAANSEAGGNALMLLLTSYALKAAEGRMFEVASRPARCARSPDPRLRQDDYRQPRSAPNLRPERSGRCR